MSKSTIRLDTKYCNRDKMPFGTKEITSLPINGEETDFVGVKGDVEVPIKFVVRGLSTKEIRQLRKYDGKTVMRRRLRIDSQGREWHDTKGDPIYDIESYTERDPIEPDRDTIMALIALGGNIAGFTSSAAGNKETDCGWYIDGEKQPINLDVYEGWTWEQAPLLRLVILKAAMKMTFLRQDEENLSGEVSDSTRSESE